MTEPNTPPAEKPASFIEDLIDIYLQPADVFRRRENASIWPPLLTVTLLLAVFSFANANVLQPIYDAEFSRQMAIVVKQNGPASAGAMEKARGFTEMATRFGAIIGVPIFVFILAAVTWLVGKLFGSKQTFHAALIVSAYAFFPRVLESVTNGIQGLLMDPASLTSLSRIQFSVARFMEPESTNAVVFALMTRLDLFTLWVTVLLAVGMCITGRISRGQAVAFGVTMWVLGSLPALRNGYMAM